MENKINEELRKHRLLLNYNEGKTLSENEITIFPMTEQFDNTEEHPITSDIDEQFEESETSNPSELDEQGYFRTLFTNTIKDAKTLKATDRALYKSLEDVIRYSRAEGNEIKGLTKPNGVNHLPIQNVDELILAVKQGLRPNELGKLYTGLLKSASTPKTMLDQAAFELVNNKNFITKYKGYKSDAALRTELANRKYSQEGIEAIIRQTKTNKAFQAARKGAGTAGTAKPVAGGAANVQQSAMDMLKKYSQAAKQKVAKIANRLSKKQLLLYGLFAGGAAAAYLLWKEFRGDGKGDEAMLPDCIANLPDIQFVPGKGGVVVGKLPDGIDEKSRGHNGLYFWPNKRVTTVDGQVKGTYYCIGGKAASGGGGALTMRQPGVHTMYEQTNPLNQNIADVEGRYSNVKIIWDGENGAAGGGGGTTFTLCTDFPFQYKCKNEKIKEIQVCLGFPVKYQTGNFGPITQKALTNKGYDLSGGITEDIYNKVKADCGGTTPTPETRNTEPMKPMEPRPAGQIAPINPGLKLQPLAPRNPITNLPEDAQPYDVYKALYKLGYFNVPNRGDRRIRYRGPELDAAQLGKLDEYFTGQGYYRRRTVPKPDDEIKYVWAPNKE